MHKKYDEPAVIIQMYVNRTIQFSEHSMLTLSVILKHCDLQETLETFHNVTSGFSSYNLTVSPSCSLLDWLLPNKDDVSLTELKLVPVSTELLVELIVKTQSDTIESSSDTKFKTNEISITNSFEDDYKVTSFEMGVLISDTCVESTKYSSEKSDESKKLVIPAAKDKLIELLTRDCNIIIEREIRTQEPKTKLKMLTVCVSQCVLISGILSRFLRWNIITYSDLPTFR
ncbi:hypothetical protein C0J52_20496 [Blattella germanica]|nr:hypothetical protein C0J52_20496 [Blattella germanica]